MRRYISVPVCVCLRKFLFNIFQAKSSTNTHHNIAAHVTTKRFKPSHIVSKNLGVNYCKQNFDTCHLHHQKLLFVEHLAQNTIKNIESLNQTQNQLRIKIHFSCGSLRTQRTLSL